MKKVTNKRTKKNNNTIFSKLTSIILIVIIAWFILSYIDVMIKTGTPNPQNRPQYGNWNLLTTVTGYNK